MVLLAAWVLTRKVKNEICTLTADPGGVLIGFAHSSPEKGTINELTRNPHEQNPPLRVFAWIVLRLKRISQDRAPNPDSRVFL